MIRRTIYTACFTIAALALTAGLALAQSQTSKPFTGAKVNGGTVTHSMKDGKAVLHVVQRPSIPEGGGVLDHIAFFGTDPSAYVAKLKERGIKYDLRRLPQPGHAGGLWQLFFFDPSGARARQGA